MKRVSLFWLRSLLLLPLGVALPLCSRAASDYTVVNLTLAVPGGDSAADLNNPGHVLLNGSGHTYLYIDGTAQEIPENFGLTNLSGVALNDHDQIIGTGTTADGLKETFQYDFATSTGKITNYIPQDSSDRLLSINNLGMTAVGQFTGTEYISNVFDAGGNSILPPAYANAGGLNNAGEIWADRSFLYNLVTAQTSDGLGFSDTGNVFGDNGWFAGSTPSALERGKLGDDEIAPTILGFADPELFASDINGNGDVVGSIWKFPELFPYRAFLANSDGIIDLNDVAPLLAGSFYAEADRINDSGEIIGFLGNQYQVDSGAFLLIPVGTPVPEASSLAWTGSGLLLLSALAWRRRREA